MPRGTASRPIPEERQLQGGGIRSPGGISGFQPEPTPGSAPLPGRGPEPAPTPAPAEAAIGGAGAAGGGARRWNLSRGEESRAGRTGAGRPGFRKRRAVLEVSGAWALGAGIPGGPAQLRSPRAPGDVSEAPKSRPGAREGGAGSRQLPPPRRVPWSRPPPQLPLWASILSPVKWAPSWALGSQVCGREVSGSSRSKRRNQKLGDPAVHLGGSPILGGQGWGNRGP